MPKADSSAELCEVKSRQPARRIFFGALLSAGFSTLLSAADDSKTSAFFEKEIAPILKQRCYECHSHEGGKAKGGLVLDSRNGWETGGDSGAAVVPGNPNQSLLIEAVSYGNVDTQMPPKGKLPDKEIALLEKWVAIGAPDPRLSDPATEKEGIDIEEGRKHWAFQPIKQATVPKLKNASWPLGEIDGFILARLEQDGIRPAVDTNRHTWLRRVTLDLTGLPPTPEQVETFISDGSEGAFAGVVDRLLSSRAYGERWARHWLDLTGYADQIGTANNVFAEHAWRYREYLIDAYNSDKPFDQFIREQIAGDLLPGAIEERSAAIIATGFLLLGNIEIATSDKEQMRVDVVDQQVNKIGTAFLGMTIACARCHDHKFDPIPQTDYYAIAGILKGTDSTHKIERGVWSGVATSELPETESQKAARAGRTEEYIAGLSDWKQRRDHARKKADTLVNDSEERKKLEGEVGTLNGKIQHAEYFAPSAPRAFAVRDVEQPGDMNITIRGNPHALGASVPRGFLQVASRSPAATIPKGQSGRIQLANWIASPDNPLPARVTVNRIWQKLFGEGLVRSVDYFGLRGETPSHPELLDYLASWFVQSGWSQKQLIRAIVLSRSYRMSGTFNAHATAIDPENRLLWRMNPQRLDAESIRDSLLAASRQLQLSSGGPALALEYPENVNGLDPKNVNPPGFSLSKYHPGQQFQRTIYLPILRSGAQPGPASLRNLFDFTQPAEIAGQRAITAVPTQALFLMNGDELKKYATELASQTATTFGEASRRIDRLWLLTYGRPASEDEKSETIRFLQAQADDESAWVELCHALLASNEFLMRL
ncbi:MAG: hypothetical protein ACI9R3_002595 [Verrucomicrobiales bacterium]